MRGVLADAGPIIALLNRNDDCHVMCRDEFRRLKEPLLTVWPVVTEVMHLVAGIPGGQDSAWEMLSADAVRIAPLDDSDMARMRELMHKYRDQGMDLADAALVRVAERDQLGRIFTLDRDFSVYRIGRQGRFSIIPAGRVA